MWEGIGNIISEEMNEDLTRPISKEEIIETVFMLKAFKALSPDGFLGKFYHHL